MRLRIESPLVLSAILLACTQLQAEVTYRTLALSGLPAPGTAPGVNYDSIKSEPRINAQGEVVFFAALEGPGINASNDIGVFLADSLGSALVSRNGDPPPGIIGDVTFGPGPFYISPLIGTDGQVAFRSYLSGVGIDDANDEAIFSDASGSLELVGIHGGAAPGAGAGVVYNHINTFVANNAGQLAWFASLNGVGVDETNNRAVYAQRDEGPTLIAREGDQVPGAAPGAVFNDYSNTPLINDMGQTVFRGGFPGGAGLFIDSAGDLQAVVLSGTAAPEAPAGTNFTVFGEFGLNNAGTIAIVGFTDGPSGTGSGLYSTQGGLHPLVTSGETAPDIILAPEFDRFFDTQINAAGDSAFLAEIDGFGINETNNYVIYKAVDGELEYIARQNALVPDATDGTRFSELAVARMHFNDAGQLAFLSELAGENVVLSNNTALFAEVAGELRLIVREGDLFDVDPDPLTDDFREVYQIDLATSGGSQDGRGSAFNAAGQLTFGLQFLDGSAGVFIAETGLSGDFNGDGHVDGLDFLVWQRDYGDAASLQIWQDNYGAPATVNAAAQPVPEPATLALLGLASVTFLKRGIRCKLNSHL